MLTVCGHVVLTFPATKHSPWQLMQIHRSPTSTIILVKYGQLLSPASLTHTQSSLILAGAFSYTQLVPISPRNTTLFKIAREPTHSDKRVRSITVAY